MTAHQNLKGAEHEKEKRSMEGMEDRHEKGAGGSAKEYGAFAKSGELQFVQIRIPKVDACIWGVEDV